MFEPPPVWWTQAMLVQFEVALVALGVGVRALADRRRPVRVAQTGY
jgi:hypothetical protein